MATIIVNMKWNLAWAMPVIDAVTAKLKNGGSVWEWGSGDSTIWLSSMATKLVSIEHSRSYYETFRLPVIKLIEPEYSKVYGADVSDPDNYLTSDGYSRVFRKYCSAIDSEEKFDVIVIDGRARPSCLKHARSKIKSEGLIVLDDAERSWYAPAIEKFIPDARLYPDENKSTALWTCP